jgi:hypothetical protein
MVARIHIRTQSPNAPDDDGDPDMRLLLTSDQALDVPLPLLVAKERARS